MTELMKLKDDLDVCYILSCAAYGKEFVDAQLHEPCEDDAELQYAIEETRNILTPIIKDEPSTDGLAEGLWKEDTNC
jgi:hypothetical protein